MFAAICDKKGGLFYSLPHVCSLEFRMIFKDLKLHHVHVFMLYLPLYKYSYIAECYAQVNLSLVRNCANAFTLILGCVYVLLLLDY